MIRRYLGFLMLRTAGQDHLAAASGGGFRCGPGPAPRRSVLVAAYAAALAWFLGWPPRQLYRAAAWCLPMLAAWLAAMAADGQPAAGLAAAPYLAWLAMWHEATAGSYLKAAVTVAPLAIPLGLVAGGLAWSWRIYSMETGSGGLAPSAPAAFDQRQWRHQVRTARARIAAPGSVPLLLPRRQRRRRRHDPDGAAPGPAGLAVIPYPRLRSHQVVLGTTGTGKTTLLLRLWAGFVARAHGRCMRRAGRPARCSSCWTARAAADSRRIADRARRVLRAAGAASTAIWPDEASLSLWALPPGQLVSTLVGHGRVGHRRRRLLRRRAGGDRPAGRGGPVRAAGAARPTSSPGWTRTGWPWPTRARRTSARAGLLRSSAGHVSDVALRYRALLRRLGGGLDGPGGFGDADAWYCILEGTAEIAVAEAQARALVDLLAWFARRAGRWPRAGAAAAGPPGHPAGGGRVQRRVPAAADLAAVRAGPLARPGRPGVGPVLAGPGRR